MNHLRLVKYIGVLAAFAAMALMPSAVNAQGPEGSYASGISCLNLTTASTEATVTFYKADGGVANSVSNDALAPNSPWLLFTPDIAGMPSNFLGSAVVSSGAETACSVNTQTNSGTTRVGTSQGQSADEAGTKLFATQIVNNIGGFDSYVAVQNVGSSAADVKATYFDSAGTQAFEQTVSIPANASKVFYQSEAGLADGFIGSATFEAVDGTTPLAGTIALYKRGTGNENAQFLSFNTFTEGAAKVFAPRLAKNLAEVGFTGGWACQNLGPGNADMTMTITMEDRADSSIKTAVLTKTGVAVNQAWSGYLGGTIGNATIDGMNSGIGSAVIESTGGKIACTFNEDNRTTFAGQGSTYGGVPDGQQSNSMDFPQIVALGANSFRGGFQYSNTTATATTCTHTYSNGDVKSNVALGANGSNSVFAESDLINDTTSFNGSVKVECGQPIVGIYNLSIQGAAAAGDPYAANNGINR